MRNRGRPPIGGFTMVEVVVAALLVSGVAVGVFSTFSTSSRWTYTPPTSAAAANLMRTHLDSLNYGVRSDTWDDSGNALEPRTYTVPDQVVAGTTYSSGYTVKSVDINADGVEDYRLVAGSMSWPS